MPRPRCLAGVLMFMNAVGFLILCRPASATTRPSLADCAQRSSLLARLQELTDEINVDNQVIANFGFDKTVQNFEEWAEEAREGNVRNLEEREREMVKRLADYGLEILTEHIKDMSPATAEKVVAFARRLGAIDEALGRKVLNAAYGDGAARELLHAEVETFMRGLGTSVSLALDAGSASQGEILADGVIAIAAEVYPPAGVLLGSAKWIYGLIYDEKRLLDKKIGQLTELTEAQLRDLKTRTLRLKEHVEARNGLQASLVKLAACDSTDLVRSASSRGPSAGAVVGGVLAGGAAIAGGVALAGQLSGKSGSSGGTCISTRNCIVSTLGNGCECSGDVNGPCDWTGPVTGRGQGGCGSGGAPCSQGLSCNNGICEDSTGRCRF